MSKFLKCFYSKYEQKQHKIKLINSQLELLKMLASGKTLKEISTIMNKSYYNIQKRTQLLYKKFDVNNRKKLILRAISEKLITNKDITMLFRRRFGKYKFKKAGIEINYNKIQSLNEIEYYYLIFYSFGLPEVKIREKMNLYNTYTTLWIRNDICNKLNVENMIQALYVAKILNII